MYEYDSFSGHEYNIRFSGQINTVQPVPVSTAMECFADGNFRFSVLAPDTRHHTASGCLVHHVSHYIESTSFRSCTDETLLPAIQCAICLATSFATGTTTALPNCR